MENNDEVLEEEISALVKTEVSIEKFESLFSTKNFALTSKPIKRQVIIFYITRLNGNIKDTNLSKIINVKEFIDSNAEDFFFIDPKVFQENSKISDNFLRNYVTGLVNITPELIIDDILYKNIENIINCTESTNNVPVVGNYSLEYSMQWIYYLLIHKNFRRKVLKHVFDQLVYFESPFDFYRFAILEVIIRKYSDMDNIIKKRCETEYNSNIPDNDANQSIVEFSGTKMSENYFYRYYVDSSEIERDNVYVLSNLIWEDLLSYLNDIKMLPEDVVASIMELLATIINKTNIFFKRRIEQNKTFLNEIGDEGFPLVDSILSNFRTIDEIYPEISGILSRMKNQENVNVLKNKRPDLFKSKEESKH